MEHQVSTGSTKTMGSIWLALLFLTAGFLLNCGKSQSQPPPPALFIAPSAFYNLSVGVPMEFPLAAEGGVGSFNWSVSAATLPHNMSLVPNGDRAMISGTPDTVESANFTIQLTDSAQQSSSQPYTVAVLLNGDLVSFSTGNLDFGPQLIGTASGQQSVTMTNISISPVSISGVATSGTDTSEFVLNGGCGANLAPSGNCTVGGVFTPAQIGPRSATITFTDSTPGSPQSVALAGVGVVSGPNATLSSANLAFGTVPIGESDSLSVTLSNYGTSGINISSIATNSDFSETNNCGTSLAPNTGCTINLTFSPSTAGTINGTLTITDDAGDSPQSAALSGAGYAGKCGLRGQGCSLVFRCCPGLICTLGGGFPPSATCQ